MQQSKWRRWWQHRLHPRWRVARYLPTAALARISAAIGRSEQQHCGQIRFVIESGWHSGAVLQGIDARRRAWQWFGELGVWDTEHNCGVLVYVSFADRQVEIVADRGIAARVEHARWQGVCDGITDAFGQQNHVIGLKQGLEQITAILKAYFPRCPDSVHRNELPNEVVLH